jgi:ATP-binding cassette, subfamily C, bacterial exporter for protease/lipase
MMRLHAPTIGLKQTLMWNRHDWLAVGCFTMVINLLMLTPTVYMLQIYDRVMASGSTLTLLALSLIALFFFGLMVTADWFRSRLLIRIGQAIDRRLAPAVFQATYRQRLQGQAVTAAQRLADLTTVRQFLTGQGLLALMDMPWAPIYLSVLFLLHPVLGGAAILFGLTQFALALASNRHAQQGVAQGHSSGLHADDMAAHLVRNADVISTLGMTPSALRNWSALHAAEHRFDNSALRRQASWGAVGKWLRYTQQSAALGVGAWLVIQGELSPGAMIAANVLTTRTLAPIESWSQTWASALAARAAMHRLKALLNSAAPESDPAPPASSGAIATLPQLEQVGVSLAGRDQPLLANITLRCQPGQITVIQGPSGSGKTTLARVLLGIQPPTQGTLSGVQPTDAQRDDVGYLPQSIELFDGSVADNIARFAKPDTAQVIAAAQLAGLHEILQRLPRGYDTPIGAGGQFLSGGQRQRIALARAVYGCPPLLVLDEPNAQLDSAGEAALHTALLRLKALGSCVVVISHRPGVLGIADQILTLDGGRMAPPAAPNPPAKTSVPS